MTVEITKFNEISHFFLTYDGSLRHAKAYKFKLTLL